MSEIDIDPSLDGSEPSTGTVQMPLRLPGALTSSTVIAIDRPSGDHSQAPRPGHGEPPRVRLLPVARSSARSVSMNESPAGGMPNRLPRRRHGDPAILAATRPATRVASPPIP
jgi:hypothetical protein